MKIYIYGLAETETSPIRYIGQTKKEPIKRLKEHCHSFYDSSPKTLWIKQLVRSGNPPVLFVLEECDPNNADGREQHWYNHFLARGHSMVNNPHRFTHQKKLSSQFE